MAGLRVPVPPPDSNNSARLPDCLLENRSRRESCWRSHPWDSSPKPAANRAWLLKISSRDTRSPPTQSESAGRPAPSPSPPQKPPWPRPPSASAPAPARDTTANQATAPAIPRPRAPPLPNFPLRRVFLFRKGCPRLDQRFARKRAWGEARAAERKSIEASRHGQQRPMLGGFPFRLESLS